MQNRKKALVSPEHCCWRLHAERAASASQVFVRRRTKRAASPKHQIRFRYAIGLRSFFLKSPNRPEPIERTFPNRPAKAAISLAIFVPNSSCLLPDSLASQGPATSDHRRIQGRHLFSGAVGDGRLPHHVLLAQWHNMRSVHTAGHGSVRAAGANVKGSGGQPHGRFSFNMKSRA